MVVGTEKKQEKRFNARKTQEWQQKTPLGKMHEKRPTIKNYNPSSKGGLERGRLKKYEVLKRSSN